MNTHHHHSNGKRCVLHGSLASPTDGPCALLLMGVFLCSIQRFQDELQANSAQRIFGHIVQLDCHHPLENEHMSYRPSCSYRGVPRKSEHEAPLSSGNALCYRFNHQLVVENIWSSTIPVKEEKKNNTFFQMLQPQCFLQAILSHTTPVLASRHSFLFMSDQTGMKSSEAPWTLYTTSYVTLSEFRAPICPLLTFTVHVVLPTRTHQSANLW